MEYTLLDTIKSGSRIRNEKSGLIQYESLPQGVKELSCLGPWFLGKYWHIVFEGTLDFDRLKKICHDKKYILIDEVEESEGEKHFREGLNYLGATGYIKEQRLGDKLFALSKPDKVYCVYKAKKGIIRTYFSLGRKQIACISWYERTQDLYFGTSRSEGLELAEDYRRSLLKR